jgi:hypothetical protein
MNSSGLATKICGPNGVQRHSDFGTTRLAETFSAAEYFIAHIRRAVPIVRVPNPDIERALKLLK